MSNEISIREKTILIVSALAAGSLLILYSFGIIEPESARRDLPSWIPFVAGIAFLLAAISVAIGDAGEWSALSAAFISLILGAIFGWISLFASNSGFSGGVAFLSEMVKVPMHRVMFGVGSIVSGLVSYFAFRSFLRARGRA